jgi:hypothetical protein
MPRISPRLAGHVRALGRMPIVRGVSHTQMTAAKVGLEGLVGNPSVADFDFILVTWGLRNAVTAGCGAGAVGASWRVPAWTG